MVILFNTLACDFRHERKQKVNSAITTNNNAAGQFQNPY